MSRGPGFADDDSVEQHLDGRDGKLGARRALSEDPTRFSSPGCVAHTSASETPLGSGRYRDVAIAGSLAAYPE
jgi:hypothetical protein